MKILVIDDSKTIRLILCKTLKDMGHETVEAGDGKQGLEAVKADAAIKLVLVDWNMPEMNGLEFVQAARGGVLPGTVPIVMVTTESEVENVKKAIAAGADEFIIKPFTRESIQAKLLLLGVS